MVIIAPGSDRFRQDYSVYTVNRLQISMHVLIGSDAGVLGITLGQFW